MASSDGVVLVTGATGRQGGAVARALLAAGVAVRALVRDPESARARAVADLGATLVRGDLGDPDSLRAAVEGAHGVFSVQMPDLADLMGDAEVRYGRALVEAASAAGVSHLVHTSVSGAGRDTGALDEQRWGAHLGHYWRSKAAVEQAVREAGFEYWTILRPSTFMENFVRPSFYWAEGDSDRLLVAVDPDVPQPFVAVDDIGAAAAAAFADPERFHRVELELAGERLTFRTAARVLSDVLGTAIELPASPEDAAAQGLMREFVLSQRYMSAHPAPAHPQAAHDLGLSTTTFAEWVATSMRA
ncbi:NmrA/HSCARG family protein [Nocardia blacklockiae]|uniref:NmrA/HSCARG family protein n=1 Tax=Nocardia blacklockiae TaxID=480036 RepID=UPI0018956CEB|nr:NmrA/HSCARG family protein [Nocardia blacklockiae]MBF6175361.1 NmrA/HSCARG family protein [Nocardia blacklockiae]